MTKSLPMANLNTIHEDITEIKVSVAHIDEHLKTLNGTIARHEQCINDANKKIEVLQQFNYKLLGGAAVAFFIIDIALKYFFKI